MSGEKKPGGLFFAAFLGAVMVLFIGILLYTWYGAEQARPVILDEKGRPRGVESK